MTGLTEFSARYCCMYLTPCKMGMCAEVLLGSGRIRLLFRWKAGLFLQTLPAMVSGGGAITLNYAMLCLPMYVQ